jgi:hypothetical protein
MDYADMMERDMQKVWAVEDAAQKAAMDKVESTMDQIWQEDTTLSEMTSIMRDDEVVMILDGVVEMLAHGGDVKKTLDDIIRPVFEKYVRQEAEHRIKTWGKP